MVVQTIDLDMLSQNKVDSSPLVLDTLDILEWSNIFKFSQKGGTIKALSCLQQYIGMLASFEAQDRSDFDQAFAVALKIVRALMLEMANSSQFTSTFDSLSTPLDLALTISQNLLIKMDFLSKSKKVKIKSIIDNIA